MVPLKANNLYKIKRLLMLLAATTRDHQIRRAETTHKVHVYHHLLYMKFNTLVLFLKISSDSPPLQSYGRTPFPPQFFFLFLQK